MSDNAPKLRFNCYLLREGLEHPTDALRPAYRPGGASAMESLDATDAAPSGVTAYFRSRSEKVPPWATALATMFPGLSNAMNMSNRLVIFLPAGGRTFAICFGYGGSTLDSTAIESNFGLRFAARRLNPHALNEVRSRRIGALSRTQSVQVPIGSDLRDLDVALDGEFVRKLVGELDANGVEFGELGAVIASDSVSFKAETDLSRISEVLELMLSEVEQQSAHEELAFIDSLEPLRASTPLVEDLETVLAAHLFGSLASARLTREVQSASTSSLDEHVLEFSPPDGVVVDQIDKVELSIKGKSDSRAVVETLTLQGLREALGRLKRKFGRSALKDVKLIAKGDDGEPASQLLPLRNWLVFEVGDADTRYILTLGKWFA